MEKKIITFVVSAVVASLLGLLISLDAYEGAEPWMMAGVVMVLGAIGKQFYCMAEGEKFDAWEFGLTVGGGWLPWIVAVIV